MRDCLPDEALEAPGFTTEPAYVRMPALRLEKSQNPNTSKHTQKTPESPVLGIRILT